MTTSIDNSGESVSGTFRRSYERSLISVENIWISAHDLLKWVNGTISLYREKENIRKEVVTLFRYLVKSNDGTGLNDTSLANYLYCIRRDHAELKYCFYRMEYGRDRFDINTIERFVDGEWVDHTDNPRQNSVFLMDDDGEEILDEGHEEKTRVDERQYIDIILGGKYV